MFLEVFVYNINTNEITPRRFLLLHETNKAFLCSFPEVSKVAVGPVAENLGLLHTVHIKPHTITTQQKLAPVQEHSRQHTYTTTNFSMIHSLYIYTHNRCSRSLVQDPHFCSLVADYKSGLKNFIYPRDFK